MFYTLSITFSIRVKAFTALVGSARTAGGTVINFAALFASPVHKIIVTFTVTTFTGVNRTAGGTVIDFTGLALTVVQ